MRRVAIPISRGKLSETFGTCSHYEIFDVDNDSVKRNIVEIPTVEKINDLPLWLKNQKVTDVIALKMDKRIVNLFAQYKINLFIGIEVDYPYALIERYLFGKLSSNLKLVEESN